MDGVLIKKQKLTEAIIQDFTWPVDAFKTQYQVCLLLIARGIFDLPKEIVYMIVKEYVYVKPLRVSFGCRHLITEEIDWCEHEILDLPIQVMTLAGHPLPMRVYERMTHEQIASWFEKHQFQVPEHFLTKNVKGRLPQH